jgi:hypothetical protein
MALLLSYPRQQEICLPSTLINTTSETSGNNKQVAQQNTQHL